MKNLKGVLEQAGTSLEKVVKSTVYITDMSLYSKISDVYATYFSEPFPAREMICVEELPLGAKVEISMVATK
jgi:2-iminobutanoate/2-iminopropanoate deaminase